MRKIILLFIFFTVYNCIDVSAQVCPGVLGQVTWECWRGTYDREIEELENVHRFPNHPDITQKVYSLEMPVNFDNYFGAKMRGYIRVDTTTTATFNITGDFQGRFYLSSDSSLDNLQLVAHHIRNTAYADHTKYPEQTTAPVVLTAGVDYYFEVLLIEGTSADFSLIWWKTDLVDPNNWTVVTSEFIRDIACDINNNCLPPGSSCDDNDPLTVNDTEDGYCHCMGVPVTSNTCVGEQHELVKYRYDGINGGALTELYNAPNYPAMPDYSEVLVELGQPQNSSYQNYGTLIQGYMAVPVTGMYMFNITSDHESAFYLSSDDDPANMNANMIYTSGATGTLEHDRFPTQTSSLISLNQGEYYYFEMHHKEASSLDHFTVFWQTPYTESGIWKRIPSMHLYDYKCEIACIPQGTMCDDGDPLTNNDMYDANCECIGTPCSGSNCDSTATYIDYDKCAVTDQLDNNESANWLSCQKTINPNPLRPLSHWIKYDMSVRHFLFQSHIWNYNVVDSLDRGFEMVAVDYSLDGSTWIELGVYTWSLATGDGNYGGFAGPDFLGAEARYVLITTLDATPSCKGLGKVAFTAVKCPFEGTPCDDGNIATLYDKYDNNCECIGVNYEENECDDQILVLGDSILTTNKYSAIETIQSISEIDGGSKVSFVGGDFVLLNAGFETQGDATFIAAIDTCDTSMMSRIGGYRSRVQTEQRKRAEDVKKVFQVNSFDDSDKVMVKFYIDRPMNSKLIILDSNHNEVYTLAEHFYNRQGLYTKMFRRKRLKSGVYTVQLVVDGGTYEEKFFVR